MTNPKNPKKSWRGYSFCDFGFLCHSALVLVISSRVSQHFLDGSVASEDAAQAVLTQRHHSKLDRLLFQCDRGRALIDQFTKRVGDFEKLVNPFASFVAGVVAGVAAFAVKKLFIANIRPRNPQLRE